MNKQRHSPKSARRTYTAPMVATCSQIEPAGKVPDFTESTTSSFFGFS